MVSVGVICLGPRPALKELGLGGWLLPTVRTSFCHNFLRNFSVLLVNLNHFVPSAGDYTQSGV